MILISFKSSFSPLEGIYSPYEIVKYAQENGYSSVLIADTNNLYGLASILNLRNESGQKVYIGAYLKCREQNDESQLLAIPVNNTGLSNLCYLISTINTEKPLQHKEFINLIKERSNGLIIITPELKVARVLKENINNIFFGINNSNIRLYHLIKDEGIKPIIFRDTIFASERDITIGIILRCIAQKRRFDELRYMAQILKRDALLLPVKTIRSRFSHIEDALINAEYIEATLSKVKYNFAQILPGSEIKDATQRLQQLAFEGAKDRYHIITSEIQRRLNYELDIISKKGYAGYFLLVKDIVDKGHLTCGRGSAAASLVSYCLKITNVDPIKHNLMFERFLNPERSDPPDIDIDFAWDEREDIIRYIFEKYKGMVAQVSNHISFSEKLAIREVARVFGFPESEINKITKIITPLLNSENTPIKLSRERISEKHMKIILKTSSLISKNMRHISAHCGGIIISNRDIRETAPVEITGGGRYVIQWDKDDIEDLNIIKIDILGNRSLAVIRDAKEMIKQNYGIDIDRKRIIFEEDPKTLELIKSGKTIGVFYIESPAMRQLQKKTNVSDFEHIVIHSSIIRPAANKYINEYVERLKGKPYKPLHPALSDLLSETYGIMCYQEDVMKVAMKVANFSYEDADRLRKTLSKKHKAERIQYYKERFFEGGIKNGVDHNTLKEIWAMIESFGGYSFCKPHSASYAQVSFMSAYIKAHFPAEFFASVIKNKGGYYSVFAYISEAKRMGIKVKPPDINISGEGAIACGDSVWLGFEDIISLSNEASHKIVTERERGGYYTSLENFLIRNPDIDFSDIRRLILSGTFDRLEGINNRQNLLLQAEISKKGARAPILKCDLRGKLNLPPYSTSQLIKLEYQMFGFPLSVHPINLIDERLLPKDRVLAKGLHKESGRYIKIVGLPIATKQIQTRSNEPMEFITLEDETDIFEVVLFPDAFRKNQTTISAGKPVVLTGKVENDHGAVYLNCQSVKHIRYEYEIPQNVTINKQEI